MSPVSRSAAAVVIACAAAVVLHRPLRAQGPLVPAAIAPIVTHIGLTPEEMLSLTQGLVVTRTATAPASLEASVIAAVRINTPKERTADYFHQFVAYVDGQVTTGWGAFSRPPAAADVEKLKLVPSDLADMQDCLPGDCAIRIGITNGNPPPVDFTAPDATARANTWMHGALSQYVSTYLRQGAAGLVAYDNQWKRIDLPNEWQQLIARSTILQIGAPGLAKYLADFPAASAPEAKDEIYWDQERATGLKPVIGLTHWVTWKEASRPNQIVLAQKQFYASHYLHAALAVTFVVQDPDAPAPSTYVFYFNRSRGELLRSTQESTAAPSTGLGGRIRAGIGNLGAGISRRAGEQMVRSSAERLLTAMKEALER